MIGRVVIALLIIIGLFAASSIIDDGIDGWRSDSITQAFTVVTGAGATSSNVTLTTDLYLDSIGRVTSVTSNVTTETPSAAAYTAATKYLTIDGLAESVSHRLTVVYDADVDDIFISSLGPFAKSLIYLFVLGATVVFVWKGGGRR